jgi:hypothetical protein
MLNVEIKRKKKTKSMSLAYDPTGKKNNKLILKNKIKENTKQKYFLKKTHKILFK